MSGKLIIYQVLVRLFGNTNSSCIPNSSYEVNGSGKFADFTTEVLDQIKALGSTHIWYTGVIEHATFTPFPEHGIRSNNFSIVKGIAGSPYSITDYYDVSPVLALNIPERQNEFRDLVRRTHDCNLKVIIDFVPNHISRDYKSDSKPSSVSDFGENDIAEFPFHPMNNFYYIPGYSFKSPVQGNSAELFSEVPAKVTGNDCFSSQPSINDWYETVKLNYGVDYLNNHKRYFNPIPDTWIKMEEILNFWIDEGVDGFRCDMAEMVPPEFWSYVIQRVKLKAPKILFIGEIYQPERYVEYTDAGFDYLYDKVGLYDTLRGVLAGERGADTISSCWQSLGNLQNRMVNFLENHDEQRVASDFFCGDPYKALPSLVVSLMLNRSPFLLYFGQELGESGMDSEGFSQTDGKTTIFDYWSVKTIREWLKDGYIPEIRKIYEKLLNIATKERAISEGSMFDLQYANPFSESYNPKFLYSFVRKEGSSVILIVVNFGSMNFTADLFLPREMFLYFNISDYESITGEDLITGQAESYKFCSQNYCKIYIEKNSFRIIKFSL
jgi:glycosidase